MSAQLPAHQFAAAAYVPSSTINSEDYRLTIRQKPIYAKVAIGKEKDRKPIDPPPVVQLHVNRNRDGEQAFLQSPYFFMSANLLPLEGEPETEPKVGPNSLAGTLVSSLHRLKDTDTVDSGFFVFCDLSVKVEGTFRLQFHLYEMRHADPTDALIGNPNPLSYSLMATPMEVCSITSIISEEFTVYPAKTFPGMSESTLLTRTFSEQGVRLRLRKEPRQLLRKRGPASDDYAPMTYRQKQPRTDDGEMQSSSRIKRGGSPLSGLQRNDPELPHITESRTQMRMGDSLFQDPYHSSQTDNSMASRPDFSRDNRNTSFNPQFNTPIARLPSHQPSEEFDRKLGRRGSSTANLRQASSDSSLQSYAQTQLPQNSPFSTMAPSQYSVPSSNRTSMSDFGTPTYTYQPPQQQHQQPNYSHAYSRSQTSINSQSPATNRGTPHSSMWSNAPREMSGSAMTSPYESPDTDRRESTYSNFGAESGDDRGSYTQRHRDSTIPAVFTNPFTQRSDSGLYGLATRGSRTISPSQTQGLGISGMYNPTASFMPPPNFPPSNNTQYPLPTPPALGTLGNGSSVPPDSSGLPSAAGIGDGSYYKQ